MNLITSRAIRALAFVALVGALLATSSPTLAWQSGISAELNRAPAPEMIQGSFGTLRIVSPDGPESESTAPEPAPAPAPALGSVIANTALGYVGYPYIAAGAGPGGFDCSGFSQYIVGITTGVWIPHAVEAQPFATGYWVNYGEWLPGDLIYFQNTYRPGVSHVGIYIGDGMIVHAENPGSGVTIDSIYSSYYGPRYWGAIRVG